MSNPSGAKGSRWERRLADYLKTHGHPHADRRVKTGRNDKGDIAGIEGWTLEAKACKRVELAAWLDEAEKEAANAGTTKFAVIFPRRNRQVDDAFAVIPAWLLTELMLPDTQQLTLPAPVDVPVGHHL